MKWAYRIIRHPNEDGKQVYGIHEVYFDDKGNVHSWTDHPTAVANSVDELIKLLFKMLDACFEEKVIAFKDIAHLIDIT
jgi:hypothetical protein